MGVWEYILRGGGRRFIKRKDSDAGEAGRALEELRGSLYNEFHTSEGAKRQQQRFCGPSVALTFNFVVSVGIILANKMVITLVLVSFGVAVATVTDLEFNFFGACVAVAWIIPSAVNKILWSNLQQSGNWTALALMWKTTPITMFFFLILMPLMDPPGLLSFNWNFKNSSAIMISALLGFLLQWSGALALGATSAVSHVVLGQFKTIVIMLSSFLVFNSDPGFTSICGAVIALGGMSIYTYLGLKDSTTGGKRIPSASRQSSHSPKSKIIMEGEKLEARLMDSV
ncbi:hypothetical protein BRADI_1g43250v3 [Brachypodium distachyon]|uniref:Sugar phosphate transporter domain-containing protein n=1 Tax=Brachypodium distachyon TaxID=15368 RepID=A0A2K2DP36_BRADI|nr:hypothetical protein BRADI_1g43250v3 [Brachypodium distachyon]